jgi:SAM-dependent methyltransferase
MVDPAAIRQALRHSADALADLPGFPRGYIEQYVARHTFELGLITALKGTDIDLWDLGGGSGLFAGAAAQLGMRPTMLDDFTELDQAGAFDAMNAALSQLGVRVIRHDFDKGPPVIDAGVEVVTTFHTIEHLHSSPRDGYKAVAKALAPGGLFVIAGPNAVNLRKRIAMPFGRVEWSTMDHWYYSPVFRAHVREPRAQDLIEIADDLGLDGHVLGKNFLGQMHKGWKGIAAKALTRLLESRPMLCSDLYLVARKPTR